MAVGCCVGVDVSACVTVGRCVGVAVGTGLLVGDAATTMVGAGVKVGVPNTGWLEEMGALPRNSTVTSPRIRTRAPKLSKVTAPFPCWRPAPCLSDIVYPSPVFSAKGL